MIIKYRKLKMKVNAADTILIIDGKYLVYRTQYSKQMSHLSHNGTKTGLYYGFFNTLKSLVNKFYPMNVVIAWDGVGSVRRDEFSGYKVRNKDYLNDQQRSQIEMIDNEYPYLVAVCSSMGLAGYVMDGYEADDLIALFTKKFTEVNKIIISKDEDLFQLIDKTTSMYDPDRKIKKDLRWFRKTYDIEPEQWKLVKAYGGCKSDTVPGIKGVGEKTAIKIIKKDPKAINKLANADLEEVKLWQRLTSLPHPDLLDVNIPYKTTHLDMDQFIDMCQKLNFRSFMERLADFELLT